METLKGPEIMFAKISTVPYLARVEKEKNNKERKDWVRPSSFKEEAYILHRGCGFENIQLVNQETW